MIAHTPTPFPALTPALLVSVHPEQGWAALRNLAAACKAGHRLITYREPAADGVSEWEVTGELTVSDWSDDTTDPTSLQRKGFTLTISSRRDFVAVGAWWYLDGTVDISIPATATIEIVR